MNGVALPGRQRCYAVCAAALGWFALAAQLYLILWGRWQEQASLLGGLVKFCSFFTVITNVLVATAFTCAVSHRSSVGHRLFRSPVVCAGIATSIALVGVAYNLLLRHLWHPQGWQWLVDMLLHDLLPLAFVAYWWLYLPKAGLRLVHVALWMVYPVVYFGYVLLRGQMLGDYLYPFLDVGSLGYAGAFVNAMGVLAGFVGLGLLVLAADRWKGRGCSART